MSDPTIVRVPEALDDTISAMVAGVRADPIFWLPVRHHSPTVARLVEHEISRRRPRVVFLEAPSEAQALVPHVIDAATKPPIAIYSSFRDDADVLGLRAERGGDEPTKLAIWYPLASYSPEYVAMRAAHAVGAEVVFIDLPHWARRPRTIEHDDAPEGEDAALLARSDFFAAIAKASGWRTFSEAWDTMFESRDPTRDAARARDDLLAFCAGARATTKRDRLERDQTLDRERHMWRIIGRTLSGRGVAPGDAMVVCGGFHVYLDQQDPEPPPEIPEGTLHTTLVPYGFSRLASQTGYGAGNRAPRFYQTLWEGRRAGRPTTEILGEHAIAVLSVARRDGQALAAADAIAVVHQTHLLASLRNRSEAVLDDLHDALISTCVKGDPEVEGATLTRAMAEVDIGSQVGRVTDAVGRLPIVRDFHAELERHGLGALLEGEKALQARLDLREPDAAARSAFLHRLVALAVPIGERRGARDALEQSIFRETWSLRWSPEIEDALVTSSLDGDTVATAAATVLLRRLKDEAGDASAVARALLLSVDMDLPGLEAQAEAACAKALDDDGRFLSLASALATLLVLERRAAYRAVRSHELAQLAARAYDRACFSIDDAAALGEDEHDGVVLGMRTLAELVLQRAGEREGEAALDRSLFLTHVESALAASPFAFLRGVFLGTLVEIRAAPVSRVVDALLGAARGTIERRVDVGALLHGVLALSRTAVALGARPLVEAIDQVLSELDADTFLAIVPQMRAGIEQLHVSQREAIAREVVGLHEGTDAGALTAPLSTSARAAALIAELDARVEVLMREWSFS